MAGNGDVRRCDACDEDVHDLTRMTDAEAIVHVRLRGRASMCVRLLAAGAAMAACATPPALPAAPPPPPPSMPMATSPPDAGAPATADGDGDGVADELDACPAEPGVASAEPNRSGCPERKRVVVETIGIVIIERVRFARGSATIAPDSRLLLEETVKVLQGTPTITRLEVQGSASTDEANGQRLSEQRAKAVVAWLVAAGVDASRLVAKGYGTSRPLADSATSDGRARNRYVEFFVLDESGPHAGPPPP